MSRSLMETPADEVEAARSLLLALLGPAAADSALIQRLVPPGVDPCGLSPPATAAPAGPNGSTAGSNGTCGPQPSAAFPLEVAQLAGIAKRRALLQGPGQDPAPACGWGWLSCEAGHIVAIDLHCAAPPCGAASASAASFALRGALPPAAPALPALRALDVSGQGALGGRLALEGWDPLPGLQVLNASGCALNGTLPYDWSALPALQLLDLRNNRLAGSLPPGLAALSSLRQLWLGNNGGLEGWLPSAWGGGLGQLELLDVRGACGLCGSTSSLAALTVALTSGSHVDRRCTLAECGGRVPMHGVFQGVLAAFSSVLGLAVFVLLMRRVRDCAGGTRRRLGLSSAAAGRNGANQTAGRSSEDDVEAGGGGRTARSGRTTRRSRHGHGHRRRHGTVAVPLYVVQFGADGEDTVSVQAAGPVGRARGLLMLLQQGQQGPAAELQPLAADGAGQGRWAGDGLAPAAPEAAALELSGQEAGAAAVGDGAGGGVQGAGDVTVVTPFASSAPGGAAAAAEVEMAAVEAGAVGAERAGPAAGAEQQQPAPAAAAAAAEGGAHAAAPDDPAATGAMAAPTQGPDPGSPTAHAAPAAEAAEAVEGDGTAVGASARRSRRGSLERSMVKLAPPPDAVVLMPDGWQVWLGVRVTPAAAATDMLPYLDGCGKDTESCSDAESGGGRRAGAGAAGGAAAARGAAAAAVVVDVRGAGEAAQGRGPGSSGGSASPRGAGGSSYSRSGTGSSSGMDGGGGVLCPQSAAAAAAAARVAGASSERGPASGQPQVPPGAAQLAVLPERQESGQLDDGDAAARP